MTKQSQITDTTLKPLHDPKIGILRVAALISGSGSNLIKILEHQKKLEKDRGKSPYEVCVIFSDNFESRAAQIGKNYDIPVVVRDLNSFCAAKGKPRKDMPTRELYDAETVKALSPYGATVAAYAGYMSIATAPLVSAFFGINVHPADLSVMENGKRKYTGAKAVRKAILAGEKTIGSTMHIIEPVVDGGRILMVSEPVQVHLGDKFDPGNAALVDEISRLHQEKLKERGDWMIFPRTLEYIADGKYAVDEKGGICFEGVLVPQGVRL
ncbi:phosphoribosylglycinamide formyltransferase [Elusimicrobiota bacterium]